jgi:hypothetical protein
MGRRLSRPAIGATERRDAELRAGAPADRARLRRRVAAIRGGVGRSDRGARPRGAARASDGRLTPFRNDERRPVDRLFASCPGWDYSAAVAFRLDHAALGTGVARPDRLESPPRSSSLRREGSSSSGGSSCARSLCFCLPASSPGLAGNCRIIATRCGPRFGWREFFVQGARFPGRGSLGQAFKGFGGAVSGSRRGGGAPATILPRLPTYRRTMRQSCRNCRSEANRRNQAAVVGLPRCTARR